MSKKIDWSRENLHSPPSGRSAGFVNNFLKVPLACLGGCITIVELSENILHNLGNDLMADSVHEREIIVSTDSRKSTIYIASNLGFAEQCRYNKSALKTVYSEIFGTFNAPERARRSVAPIKGVMVVPEKKRVIRGCVLLSQDIMLSLLLCSRDTSHFPYFSVGRGVVCRVGCCELG